MIVYGPSLPSQPIQAPVGSAPKAVSRSAEAPPESTSEDSLRAILTDEEREFFAKQAQLGDLTYGPRKLSPHRPAGPIGQRVDVRA
jgi:hypothetical protein